MIADIEYHAMAWFCPGKRGPVITLNSLRRYPVSESRLIDAALRRCIREGWLRDENEFLSLTWAGLQKLEEHPRFKSKRAGIRMTQSDRDRVRAL